MARLKNRVQTAKLIVVIFTAGLLLSGCTHHTLWASLTGEDPSGKPKAQTKIKPARAEANPQPALSPPPPVLGKTNFVAPKITQASSTGTYVGQRVVRLRKELKRLQTQITQQNSRLQVIRKLTVQHSQRYHLTVGSINAKLQVGTTPGNPKLVNQWNKSQTSLAQIENDIAQMNTLANSVASTSTLSAYLLETTRAAYGLSGAIDEDHRQLATLEDEVNRTVVLIDRLLNELSEDISRQSNYLSTERVDLTTLALAIKNGELLGPGLGNRAYAAVATNQTNAGAASPTTSGPRRPLVVIRFDRKNVKYEQPLYNAISRALQRRPNAMFDLVAVAPNEGSTARATLAANASKKHAESVLRSLSDMGLPLDRVRLSALTSKNAQTNEVHLYVR